jgi:hypothetical protein
VNVPSPFSTEARPSCTPKGTPIAHELARGATPCWRSSRTSKRHGFLPRSLPPERQFGTALVSRAGSAGRPSAVSSLNRNDIPSSHPAPDGASDGGYEERGRLLLGARRNCAEGCKRPDRFVPLGKVSNRKPGRRTAARLRPGLRAIPALGSSALRRSWLIDRSVKTQTLIPRAVHRLEPEQRRHPVSPLRAGRRFDFTARAEPLKS